MTAREKAELIKKLIITTVTHQKLHADVHEVDRKLYDFFTNGPFGCKNRQAMQLVSILTGRPLSQDHTNTLERHVVVVPLKNTNSHNYDLKEPVVIGTRGDHAIRRNGDVGNHLDLKSGSWRYATEAEIKALPAAQLIAVQH